MRDADLFPGFRSLRIEGDGATVALACGGSGPPLLLLHGYPQTHAMWHRIAPALARRYTVVCADLRGYGDSSKPPTDASHAPYAKRGWPSVRINSTMSCAIARLDCCAWPGSATGFDESP